MKIDYDVLVIGAGACGMSALIYLKRSNLKCAVIEKSIPGGLLNKCSVIENYPGFSSISGPSLAEVFYSQISDVLFINEEVVSILCDGDFKVVKTNLNEYRCRAVILSIGRKPKSIESVKSLVGKGVSFCSLCDGFLYKGCDVAIVGAGNSAVSEALYLSDICSKVYILCRGNKLASDYSLTSKVNDRDNIEVIYNCNVSKFNTCGEVLDSVDVCLDDKNINIKVKACFMFIGYEPSSNFLKNLDILDEKGYIIVDARGRTSIFGIYAGGDIIRKDAYQVITACSDGVICAISCIKDLEK